MPQVAQVSPHLSVKFLVILLILTGRQTSSLQLGEVKGIAGQTILLTSCPEGGEGNWFKDSHRLPVNKRQEVDSLNGSLILREVQKVVDDGVYSCRNPTTSEEKSTKVIVQTPPLIGPFDFPRNIVQGMRVRLTCTILQGDPPIRFTWLKDGKVLDPIPLSLGVRSDDYSIDLTFSRVTPRHNGNYTCLADNDVDQARHSATLRVDVPPVWKVEPQDSSVVGGLPLRIDCLAEGVPSPVMTWERGSASINSISSSPPLLPSASSSSSTSSMSSPRFFTVITSGPHFEVHPNGSLLVKEASEDDAGFYLCQASNSIGPGLSKVISISVHVPPRFASKFQSQTVRIGESVIIKCEAVGDQPMTMEWIHDKNPVRKDKSRFERKDESSERKISSSIRISKSTREDSGVFTCFVKNKFGEDESNIQLIVQEPPEPPRLLKVAESTSRSVKLSWSIPFNGNNQIIKYWISCTTRDNQERVEHQTSLLSSPDDVFFSSPSSTSSSSSSANNFKTSSDVRMSVDFVPGSTEERTPSGLVRGLRPSTTYLCSIRAENEVGLSISSHRIEVRTDEEAPGGPPLDVRAEGIDGHSVRISWKAPDRSTWNGPLKGYYVGYRVSTSNDQYLYKTIEYEEGSSDRSSLNSSSSKGNLFSSTSSPANPSSSISSTSLSSHSVILSPLKPFTEYSVLVQAFNSMGAGPQSDPLPVKTDEGFPSEGPSSLTCSPSSPETLTLSWDPPPSSSLNGILKGYRVIYRPLGVPGPPSHAKVVVSSSDSAIVTWKDPVTKNGVIVKYTVYWREVNKTRTKTAVSVPKGRSSLNVFSTKYRVTDGHPQYKMTGLKEETGYEVWVTAWTRIGEGSPTEVVTMTPTRLMPARIVELPDRIVISGGEFTPFVLPCHVVGSEPLQKTWMREGELLKMEADGSLLIDSLDGVTRDEGNFSCRTWNAFGNDEITYQLVKESATTSSLTIKVTSTSFTSAQVILLPSSSLSSSSKGNVNYGPSSGYEVYYRLLGSTDTDWILVPSLQTLDTNHSVILDDLLCGSTYSIFAVDLDSGSRTETISFKTQGTAPIAPRRENILRVVNESTLLIYPSSWDHPIGCPITKLTIEYRSSSQHTWTVVSSQPPSDEVIELSNLVSKSLYSVRMTAHTKGSPSTMAEYEARIGLPEEFSFSSDNPRSMDNSTMISLMSSLFVLLLGFVAVFSLVSYKRRLNNRLLLKKYSSRKTSATSNVSGTGATSIRTEISQSDLHVHRTPTNYPVMSRLNREKVGLPLTPDDVIEILPGGGVSRGNTTSSDGSGRKVISVSPGVIRGRLPKVPIPRKQLDEIDKDAYNEYDEIEPYATFHKVSTQLLPDDMKTFSVRIGEPAYHFKGAMDAHQQQASSHPDYKLLSCRKSSRRKGIDQQTQGIPGGIVSDPHQDDDDDHDLDDEEEEDGEYRVSAVAASITSTSTNHTELIRAYEYGKKRWSKGHPSSGRTVSVSEKRPLSETPTDPGIRRFTKSPPRPNEKRMATVSYDPYRQTDTTEDEEDDEPEVEDDEDESDVLTASPACSTYDDEEEEDDLSTSPSTPTNDQQPADTFSALPRNRSRHPSWAQQAQVKGRLTGHVARTSRLQSIVSEDGKCLSSDDNESDDIDRVRRSRRNRKQEEEMQKKNIFLPSISSSASSSTHLHHSSFTPHHDKKSSSSPSKRPPARTKSTLDEIEC